MVIILHVLSAIAGLVLAGTAAFWPSPLKLRFTILLTLSTVATGTYIIITAHTSLLSICLSGLVYLTVISGFIATGAIRLRSG
jgi:hypothetical protein